MELQTVFFDKNGLSRGGIKEARLRHVKSQEQQLPTVRLESATYTGNKGMCARQEVEISLCAHRLNHFNARSHVTLRLPGPG